MIVAPILFALMTMVGSVTPQEADVSMRFCRALTDGSPQAFLPLATSRMDYAQPSWRSVRDLLDGYECISISSYRVRSDRQAGCLVLDIDGSGTTKNERRERRPIPPRWYLTLTSTEKGTTVAAAEDEGNFVAHALLRVETDAERQAIGAEHAEVMRDAAFAVSEIALKPPVIDREVATFLLDWSMRYGDPEMESYALLAFASIANGAQSQLSSARQSPESMEAVQRFTEAARVAARRSSSCDAAVYADLISGALLKDPGGRWALLESVAAAGESLTHPTLAVRATIVQFGIAYTAFDISRSNAVLARLSDLSDRYRIGAGQMTAVWTRAILAASIEDFERASVFASQMALLAREQVSPVLEATAWELLGQFHGRSEPRPDRRALDAYRLALQVMPAGNTGIAVYVHTGLGQTLLALGHKTEAESHLGPAMEAARATGENLIGALNFATEIRLAEGRYEEAMAFAREGIELEKQSLWTVWALKFYLGQTLIECGDADAGIEELRASIDLIETRRSVTTSDPMVRVRHQASRRFVYESLVRALFDQNRYEEALEVAERMRGRTLMDSVSGTTPPQQLTLTEQSQEKALQKRLIDLNRTMVSSTGSTAAQTRLELHAARVDLDDFTKDMAVRYARPSAPLVDVPFLAAAAGRAAVVEYTLLPETILVFVVRDGRVVARQLPRDRKTIEDGAARLLERIEQRDVQYSRDARVMYDALLAPIAGLLPHGGTLTIAPDGFLWNVPFDVLEDRSGRLVAKRHALTYAPSLAMVEWDARRRPVQSASRKTLLALGDPFVATSTARKAAVYRDLSLGALPDAVREVHALADLYGPGRSTVLTGHEARETTLKKISGHYRILHLATHGIIDQEAPLYSALVLARSPEDSDDGLLEMREMHDLDLHADLVVLSGCDTAQGHLYQGEGVIGMAWALLSAGCPTTVVSRWKADSRSTATLMVEFHRRLLAGDTPAQALHHAKLTLRNNPWYAHPFYWAPFMVVGGEDKPAFRP